MSPEERARLARALADFDATCLTSDPNLRHPGRFLTIAAVGCGLILAAWIGLLAVTLPHYFRVGGGWRLAWVGFDVGLLAMFAATAWAAWKKRQVLITCLVVLATLLTCDAWFDTTLDIRTGGFFLSLLSALLIELPLAVIALGAARRLLRLTIGWLEVLEGVSGPVPPFWRVPLYGNTALGYRDLLRTPTRAQRPSPNTGGG